MESLLYVSYAFKSKRRLWIVQRKEEDGGGLSEKSNDQKYDYVNT